MTTPPSRCRPWVSTRTPSCRLLHGCRGARPDPRSLASRLAHACADTRASEVAITPRPRPPGGRSSPGRSSRWPRLRTVSDSNLSRKWGRDRDWSPPRVKVPESQVGSWRVHSESPWPGPGLAPAGSPPPSEHCPLVASWTQRLQKGQEGVSGRLRAVAFAHQPPSSHALVPSAPVPSFR